MTDLGVSGKNWRWYRKAGGGLSWNDLGRRHGALSIALCPNPLEKVVVPFVLGSPMGHVIVSF